MVDLFESYYDAQTGESQIVTSCKLMFLGLAI